MNQIKLLNASMKFKKILLITSLVFLANPAIVSACSCMNPGTPTEELQKADAVFSGQVIDIQENSYEFYPGVFAGEYQVKIQVDNYWKNANQSELDVYTNLESTACGYDFELGEKYLVFAYANDEDRLSTSWCSLTQPLDGAKLILEEIGAGKELDPIANIAGRKPLEAQPIFLLIGLIVAMFGVGYLIFSAIRQRKNSP